jgi:AcrR family transcriptional regulator
MGRPRRHDQHTAQALLDAAEDMVANGTTWPSLRAVAEKAGTTTRAVYTLFGSKEGLVAALAERGFGLLESSVSSVPHTSDPLEDLVEAGLRFRRFALDHPSLFRLTFERVPAEVLAASGVAESGYQSFRALRRLVRRAQQAGALPDDMTANELSYTFHAVCQGLASCELAGKPPPVGASMWPMIDGSDPEFLWRRTLRAFLQGLQT